ncbi:histidine-specific methyltransferase [Scleroderma citrinum]
MQDSHHTHGIHVLDIRSPDASRQLADQISRGLDAPLNKKILPSMILYDEAGLLLYDKFSTESPEFYLFRDVVEVLKVHADEIVQTMHNHSGNAVVSGEVIIDLGAGSLRKTTYLLRALSDMVPASLLLPPVTFYALDLDGNELRRALNDVHNSDVGPSLSGKVETKGLWGTYADCFEFIMAGEVGSSGKEDGSAPLSQVTTGTDTTSIAPSNQPPIHFLLLGSIEAFYRGDDSQFLRSLPLRPGDTLLLGLSHALEHNDLAHAYKDTNGYCRAFAMNGLNSAGNALGNPSLFDKNNWDHTNTYNEERCCFEGFYKCLRSHEIYIGAYNQTVQFLEGELVQVSVSSRYSETDTHRLFNDGQLRPIQRWVDNANRHSHWLLERSPNAAEHRSST